MKCPNTDCNIDIELTWSRYFKNLFSRFVCPECSAKFKYQRPFTWYLWFVAWCLGYIASLIIFANFLVYMDWPGYWVVSIVAAAIYLPIDRSLESKYPTKLR